MCTGSFGSRDKGYLISGGKIFLEGDNSGYYVCTGVIQEKNVETVPGRGN